MTPSKRLGVCALIIAGLGLLTAFQLLSPAVWLALAVLYGCATLADLVILRVEQAPHLTRHLPSSLPVGVPATVRLQLENRTARPRAALLHDLHPHSVKAAHLPLKVILPASSTSHWDYRIWPSERGDQVFRALHCTIASPLGLWWYRHMLQKVSTVRVYPNFAAMSRYAMLASENRLVAIGVRKKRRRGLGSEFQQLREFRQGDSLRRIDWRAMARTRKLIAREYQDERDQTILFLLDCGRRMRAKDGELTHFDESLNALLLLAYVALRKGDAVGVGTFAGENRWLSPLKGHAGVNRLLNQLYDVQPGLNTPDYAQMAINILARHKKHALVIIITNLRDEDAVDLQAAVATLARRHSILVASTREEAIDHLADQPVAGFSDALRITAAHHYTKSRLACLNRLRAGGVACLDVAPGKLSTELINTYLAMKASGAI